MNEARMSSCTGGAGADLVLCSDRESPTILYRIKQFLPHGKMVHKRNRSVKDGTEIRWSYELEVYQCTACNAIMGYQFDFKVCPYCDRPVVHTDSRSFGRSS